MAEQQTLLHDMIPSGIACGIDLVEHEKFNRIISVGKDRFIQRAYTAHEQTYCAGDLHQLSARWAAKEAVAKALGTGFRVGVDPIDIEIEHCANGAPTLHLHGRARTIAEQSELFTWSVSLSHEKHFVVAIAIALRQKMPKDAKSINSAVLSQSECLKASDLIALQEIFEGVQAEASGRKLE